MINEEILKEIEKNAERVSLENHFPKYEELDNKKTALEELVDEVACTVNDELEIEKTYHGKIKRIYFDDGIRSKYKSINIVYELNDDGIQKTTCDSYLFGGNYDTWNMKQLLSFIKKIDGLYLGQINFKTYETLVESLHFLVGSDVILYQYLTTSGNVKNNVTVIRNSDKINTDYKEEKQKC